MKNELTKLYNTMLLVETKGESTKLMAQCLNFVAQLANQCAIDEMTTTPSEGEVAE